MEDCCAWPYPSGAPKDCPGGTLRQRELALSRRNTEPNQALVPMRSFYVNKANQQYWNSEKFLSTLISTTPFWATSIWPTLQLVTPSSNPFFRLDSLPRRMRRRRSERCSAGSRTPLKLSGTILRRSPVMTPCMPQPQAVSPVVGPLIGWDFHPQMIWCVDRSGMDSPDSSEAALFGHARHF